MSGGKGSPNIGGAVAGRSGGGSTMKRWDASRRWVLAVAACGLALMAGCRGGSGPDEDEVVVVDGSSTVFQINRAAQEAYATVEPQARTVVDKHGTGGGFIRYLQNEVDLVGASRAAKKEEEAKAKAQGLEWVRFLVGYDGITVVVHPSNDFARELSVDQLKKLWSPDGTARTWRDLDPAWPDRPIRLYGPDKNSGTFDFFTGAIVGKAKRQREDVQSSPDDNVLVRGVSGDPDAMGYLGYAYYKMNADKVAAVGIKPKADAPAVLPAPDTILSKKYTPLSRPLYLYAKKAAARRPAVARFLDYYLAHLETLAPRAGYVAPTSKDAAANRDTFAPYAPSPSPTETPAPAA